MCSFARIVAASARTELKSEVGNPLATPTQPREAQNAVPRIRLGTGRPGSAGSASTRPGPGIPAGAQVTLSPLASWPQAPGLGPLEAAHNVHFCQNRGHIRSDRTEK